MADVVRLLIVDDHPLYREGLAGLLAASEGFEVVGLAGDGAEAVELAAALAPDVVVMDVDLPVMTGVEATRLILAARPQTRVLALSMHDDDTVFEAVRAGAHGYLVKSSSPAATLAAIRSLAAGDVVFSETLAGRIADRLGAGVAEPLPGLTPREREVLRLVARGLSNQPIAARLGVSEKTVRNLLSTILAKLGVADRAAAAAKARAAGLH